VERLHLRRAGTFQPDVWEQPRVRLPHRDARPRRHRRQTATVKIVAPNLMHHLSFAAAKARWPQAEVIAPPGLREKVPGLPIDPQWWLRTFMTLNGCYGRLAPSRLFHSMVKDPARPREDMAEVLSWDFDSVALCHGRTVPSGAKALMPRKDYGL
jgi:hypothetical protein